MDEANVAQIIAGNIIFEHLKYVNNVTVRVRLIKDKKLHYLGITVDSSVVHSNAQFAITLQPQPVSQLQSQFSIVRPAIRILSIAIIGLVLNGARLPMIPCSSFPAAPSARAAAERIVRPSSVCAQSILSTRAFIIFVVITTSGS